MIIGVCAFVVLSAVAVNADASLIFIEQPASEESIGLHWGDQPLRLLIGAGGNQPESTGGFGSARRDHTPPVPAAISRLQLAIRFQGDGVSPTSANPGGTSSQGSTTGSGNHSVAALACSNIASPPSLLLSWFNIENALDVPPAPAVELSRPPQTLV